jgi:hypothetical protein
VYVFLDKIVLVLSVGLILATWTADSLKLDIHYKIGITVTILGLAYAAAHTVYQHNNQTILQNRSDLKQRATQLSKDIVDFLAERGRIASAASASQKDQTWEQETDMAVQRYQETFQLYNLKYADRVTEIRNELAEHKLTDLELDKNYIRPTTISDIHKIGERIGVLADMLPNPTS